ncbi:MAG: hypothetical protein M1132_08690 [Chloroflexi bacterium]|nr:hypothetical protein [Chloroflexota bacterium]
MRRNSLQRGALFVLTALALMLVTTACSGTDASQAAPPSAATEGATPGALATIGFRVSGWT